MLGRDPKPISTSCGVGKQTSTCGSVELGAKAGKYATMKMMCPISFKQVNERAVQLNAALAALSMILFLFTSHKWLIAILSVDLFIRGFFDSSYSLFSAISRTIVRIFQFRPVMVNGGPKIFAARIGFIFCCIIVVLYLLNFQTIGLVVGCVFVLFALFEAIFRFCLACKIYPFVYKN